MDVDSRPWVNFAPGRVVCPFEGCGTVIPVMVEACAAKPLQAIELRPNLTDVWAHVWACPYNPGEEPDDAG
jgi:hypothetical protein